MSSEPKNTSLRLGIIGTGGFARAHLATLEREQARESVRLVAAADPFLPKDPDFQHQLENAGTQCFDDYEAMLAQGPELDALLIATPIPLHYTMAKACLATGLPIYLEKPAVPALDQLDDLLASGGNERLAIGFQMVSWPLARRLKAWLDDGGLGTLEAIHGGACWPRGKTYYNRAAWSGKRWHNGMPVFDGPATNGLSHAIMLGLFLASGQADGFACPASLSGELYRVKALDSYDTFCATGVLHEGPGFAFGFTHGIHEHLPSRIKIRGSRGEVTFLIEHQQLTSPDPVLQKTLDAFIRDCPGGPELRHPHHDFFAWVRGEQSRPAVRLADTRGYNQLTLGAWLSSGDIHALPDENKISNDNGDLAFPQLTGAIEHLIETGQSFAASGHAWAKAGRPLDAASLQHPPFP